MPDLPRKTNEQIKCLREFLNVASLSVFTKQNMTVSFRSASEEDVYKRQIDVLANKILLFLLYYHQNPFLHNNLGQNMISSNLVVKMCIRDRIIMGDHPMNKPMNACALCGQCMVI